MRRVHEIFKSEREKKDEERRRQEEEEEQRRLEEEKEYAIGFCVPIEVPMLSVDNDEVEYRKLMKWSLVFHNQT